MREGSEMDPSDQKAEEQELKKLAGHVGFCGTVGEHREIIHKLEVYQIELEMQNQELKKALEKAATATALYDFSPAGYFTIDQKGIIREMNYNGACMLRNKRSQLVNTNFMHFVSPGTLPIFQDFLHKAIHTGSKQVCEVTLVVEGNCSIYVHLEGFVAIREHQCMVTAIDISKNKKAEEVIRLNESRLRRAELASKAGNWEFHIGKQTVYASQGAIKLYGLDNKTFEFSDIKERPLPEYRPVLDLAMKNLVDKNLPYDVEFKIKTADTGQIRVIHSTATFDKEREIIFGSIQDITERKHMEDRLHESEQYYRTMVESSPDAIIIVDTTGQLKFASQRAYELLFLPTDHPIGSSIVQWIAPEMRPLTLQRFSDILSEKIEPESFEYKILKSDGVTVWLEIHGSRLFDKKGKIEGMFLVCRDVTERRYEKEALQLAHDELKNLHDNLDEAIFSFDPVNNRMLQASQAHESIFGFAPSAFFINPHLWYDLIIAEDKPIVDAGFLIVASGQKHQYEFRIMHPDGQLRWIASKMRPTLDQEGRLIQVDGIAYDITGRKRDEAELIAAKEKAEESDRLKSAFLANMSHEIRTPLNSIIGFSELMSEPDFEHSQGQQYAQIINASGHNLLTIISDIMDISKIEAGQVQVKNQVFSVNQLLFDLQKEYSFKAKEKGIELMLDPSNPLEEIYLKNDPAKIRQILVNLLGNSIKFTEKGFIHVGMKIMGNLIQFHVKDTGIGIADKYQAQIFERFHQVESSYTRKYGGAGLGLAISKSLTELLGGNLRLESRQGQGSTFYFTLPFHPNPG